MAKRKKYRTRDERIDMEVVVDAYDRDERALGWYYHLEGKLNLPFSARCVARRAVSPLKIGDEAQVIGMPQENECLCEMFVTIRFGGGRPGRAVIAVEGREGG